MTEEDSDEYTFSACNLKLFQDTITFLKCEGTSFEWPLYTCHDELEDFTESSDAEEGIHGDSDKPTTKPGSQLGGKRVRSSDSETEPKVKRGRRPSDKHSPPPSSKPVSSTDIHLSAAGEDWVVTDLPLPKSVLEPAANVTNDSMSAPCSSDLEVAAPAAAPAAEVAPPSAAGSLSAAEVAAFLQLPIAQLGKQLQLQLPRLQTEQNLVTVAGCENLSDAAARSWLELVVTPRLCAGPLPSAPLSAALTNLAQRRPDALLHGCLLPLSEGVEGPADPLLQRLAVEGLPERQRAQLVSELCGRPLGGAAVALLLSLLPAVTLTSDMAAGVAGRLAAAAELRPDSAAVARAALLLARRAGAQLEPTAAQRLRHAAEQSRTPLRRPLLAVLAPLCGS